MSTTAVATHWSDALADAGACIEALAWARTQPDTETAWTACERGDWMLWGWGRLAGGAPWSDVRKPLVLAACACARLALPIVEAKRPGETRPRAAIETAERWARGEDGVTPAQVRDAAASAYAAYAAAASAYAAAASAYAAYAAADAASAYAADADAWRGTRAQALRECADAIRAVQPTSPWRTAA